MSEPVLDLNDLRQRILSGGSYTKDELRAAISAIRVNRVEAATKTVATKTKKAAASAKAAPMSDDELDASLRGLGLDL